MGQVEWNGVLGPYMPGGNGDSGKPGVGEGLTPIIH